MVEKGSEEQDSDNNSSLMNRFYADRQKLVGGLILTNVVGSLSLLDTITGGGELTNEQKKQVSDLEETLKKDRTALQSLGGDWISFIKEKLGTMGTEEALALLAQDPYAITDKRQLTPEVQQATIEHPRIQTDELINIPEETQYYSPRHWGLQWGLNDNLARKATTELNKYVKEGSDSLLEHCSHPDKRKKGLDYADLPEVVDRIFTFLKEKGYSVKKTVISKREKKNISGYDITAMKIAETLGLTGTKAIKGRKIITQATFSGNKLLEEHSHRVNPRAFKYDGDASVYKTAFELCEKDGLQVTLPGKYGVVVQDTKKHKQLTKSKLDGPVSLSFSNIVAYVAGTPSADRTSTIKRSLQKAGTLDKYFEGIGAKGSLHAREDYRNDAIQAAFEVADRNGWVGTRIRERLSKGGIVDLDYKVRKSGKETASPLTEISNLDKGLYAICAWVAGGNSTKVGHVVKQQIESGADIAQYYEPSGTGGLSIKESSYKEGVQAVISIAASMDAIGPRNKKKILKEGYSLEAAVLETPISTPTINVIKDKADRQLDRVVATMFGPSDASRGYAHALREAIDGGEADGVAPYFEQHGVEFYVKPKEREAAIQAITDYLDVQGILLKEHREKLGLPVDEQQNSQEDLIPEGMIPYSLRNIHSEGIHMMFARTSVKADEIQRIDGGEQIIPIETYERIKTDWAGSAGDIFRRDEHPDWKTEMPNENWKTFLQQ